MPEAGGPLGCALGILWKTPPTAPLSDCSRMGRGFAETPQNQKQLQLKLSSAPTWSSTPVPRGTGSSFVKDSALGAEVSLEAQSANVLSLDWNLNLAFSTRPTTPWVWRALALLSMLVVFPEGTWWPWSLARSLYPLGTYFTPPKSHLRGFLALLCHPINGEQQAERIC